MKTAGVALASSQIGRAFADEPNARAVRMVELEIDPARLEPYQAALQEEIETSVRVEPGVVAIYAVAERNERSKLRLFEIYVDEAAYAAHIESPHYRKYAAATKDMITSRRLIDTVPIVLGVKTSPK